MSQEVKSEKKFVTTRSGAAAVHSTAQATNFSELKELSYEITGHPEKGKVLFKYTYMFASFMLYCFPNPTCFFFSLIGMRCGVYAFVYTDTWTQLACGRANLRACGDFKDEDFGKPFITICAPYSNGLPCNHQFKELADILQYVFFFSVLL